MAAPPICRNCGSALPRAAITCPKCGNPVFVLTGRRARQRRNASVVGMAGSLLMAAQSTCMLIGGGIALIALQEATAGRLGHALAIAATAAIAVGFALLFDLVGIAFLVGAFHLFTKAARAGRTTAAADPSRQVLVSEGFRATVCLTLWLVVTVIWRGALAAIVSFYPSPFGGGLGTVSGDELRRAASVMLALWAGAAFLLFLGSVFGTRFLMRTRNAPLTPFRLLWPLETLLHSGAAFAILIVAPGLLASLRIELSTLALIEVLGVLDLLVVPILGLLAYLYLFRDFLRMYQGTERPIAASPPPTPTPTEPPAGEP